MLHFERIYLVRHGSYSRYPEEKLTADGRTQSENAGWQLHSLGVGQRVMLLSSDAPRALQTADIVSLIIEAPVMPSRRINIVGNHPEGVESLDHTLEAALTESGAEPEGGSLVVVAHQPLMEIAALGARVANGEVIEYRPQTWQNPEFNEMSRQDLAQQLGAAGLA